MLSKPSQMTCYSLLSRNQVGTEAGLPSKLSSTAHEDATALVPNTKDSFACIHSKKNEEASDWHPIKITNLQTILCILMSGLILGVVAFSLENLQFSHSVTLVQPFANLSDDAGYKPEADGDVSERAQPETSPNV